jgi:nucleoside-diphosphate-sugar epimerase
MAEATLNALERWPSRQALIVADDRPTQWREVFEFVTAAVGAPPPQAGGIAALPSFRVRNRRARAALSWTPFYADHRAGMAR